LVPWDHRRAGTTLDRNGEAAAGDDLDRQVADAIEVLEFLAGTCAPTR
jgi:hypothetical protein